MSDFRNFVAGVNSDARKNPVRVAFVTRRTSAEVKAYDESKIQSFPEVLFRAAIAVEVLAGLLVMISLFFNAPLEGLAIHRTLRIRRKRPGTSSDCRSCCTTFRRSSPVCSYLRWWCWR